MRKLGTAVFALLFALLAQAQAQTSQPKAAAQPTTNQASQGEASGAPAGGTAIDPAKEADIRRLLEVLGTKSMMSELMGNMEKSIRPMLVNALPPGDYRKQLIDLFVDKFTASASVEFPKLVDAEVPIYDKYYSDEDIKGLIQFYQSPLGKKTVTVLPKIMIEMQSEGQKLGERIGQESMMQVLSEHPELAKAMQDAQSSAAH